MSPEIALTLAAMGTTFKRTHIGLFGKVDFQMGVPVGFQGKPPATAFERAGIGFLARMTPDMTGQGVGRSP